MSGMVIGIIIAVFLYAILLLNVVPYINYMNMDVNIYKNFTIYSVVQLFIQLVFMFVIEKLYYEEKNTLANKYSITFNLLNFIILIGTSLIIKNQFSFVKQYTP